ncbi:MAG TPA: hypothetical protein VIX17_04365 [Pyrinomonadaceae bacterium]|jgi:hypothetical protein
MKRCPECNSLFAGTEKFCELDGTALVETADNREFIELTPNRSRQTPLFIVATVGLVIGVLLALMYLVLTRDKAPKPIASSTSTPTTAPQTLPARPSTRQAEAVPSPTIEPSPSPSPSAEPSPSVQPSPEQVKLSMSPISTARGKDGGPLTIKLNTGVTIEADEAWQTSEGIWYRKGGMVALLDPKDIKAVEKRPVR